LGTDTNSKNKAIMAAAGDEERPSALDDGEDENGVGKQKIYTYQAPWETYGLSWSSRKDKPFRLAVSSFLQEYGNKVEILRLNEEEKKGLEKTGSFDHPYPATKIMWVPDFSTSRPDLLATTGDYLRLWDVNDTNGTTTVKMKSVLNNVCSNKKSDFCAPLTSFDWNADDPRLIATSSIDTTCSIWDIETEQATTQLIAHDKEVYDIAFAKGNNIFASVGADGSVRLFDLRSLEHSTIVYESQDLAPILRLCWNKQDPNYIATILVDSPSIIILDVRIPSMPVALMNNHTAAVNSIQWAPHSSCHICSAADDTQALIWDLSTLPKPVEDPILAYNAESEINTLQWSSLQNDWVSIAYSNQIQILRV
jgi:WD repeat-containing protein 68